MQQRSSLPSLFLAALAAFAGARCDAGESNALPPPTSGAGGTAFDGSVEATVDAPNDAVLPFDTGGGKDGAEPDADADSEGGATIGCGDGAIQPGEKCDDGNSESGDGCSAGCDAVESDFACPTPGKPCVSTVVCGDGIISGGETCDDADTQGQDGCSGVCEVEPGWACPVVGQRCEAAQCGDGVVAGSEECDDGQGPASGDGCSDTCKLENGFACPVPGQPCHGTVCNDGVKEGFEPCDDGNLVVGDGCNPFCEVEPNCSAGACVSACGDGLILPGDNEQCDDGNSKSGDGCSASCQVEDGFGCTNVLATPPDTLEVPITFRDFVSLPAGGSVRHADFEVFGGTTATLGLVAATLGSDGKPVYTGICEQGQPLNGASCPYGAQTTGQGSFDQWYRDVPGVNQTRVAKLSLAKQPNSSYFFPDASFFPWDGAGWVAAGQETTFAGHNFGFTTELRTWFEFKGGEQLSFSGDDDVWVFINHTRVVDIGGLHPPQSGAVTLDGPMAQQLGLEVGKIYETALFQAERHTDGSNFNLTLAGFLSARSHCDSLCGDGIVVGDEVCDDGVNDGTYGSCLPGCAGRGPQCGDGIPQNPQEECDNGVNLATYSATGQPGCAPGCKLGAFCGDSQIDSLFGEACDDGVNVGGYGACAPGCVLGMRCGDGVTQADQGESCDDGNRVSGDGCSAECVSEGPS